ncbi:MAG: HD-GYP domain-containing protein [Sporomusaceae bacterium]|nr:HD-GYP domain-containing protein [Sporomusaceae bacterium]
MAGTKRLTIDKVEPGMRLADVVLNEMGKVLLEKGTVLTEALLQRMQEWNVMSVVVAEAETAPTVSTQADPVATEWQNSMQTPKEFSDPYHDTVERVRVIFQQLRQKEPLPLQEIFSLVKGPISYMINAVGVINHLQQEYHLSDYTYHHSVNVAIITGLLGKWLELSKTELFDLIVSGLLHDVGKSQIPSEILDKPSQLTPEEMALVQQHAYFGYQIVRQEKALSANAVCGILQHHERMDGSGYPLHAKKDAIHLFGRIVAIADIYDAMTSNRSYREKVAPFTVIEALINDMYQKLDVEICTVFLNNVRDCFLGNIVVLNNGQQAEVIYLGQFMAARPVVRTDKGEFIDLERRKDLSIVKLMHK